MVPEYLVVNLFSLKHFPLLLAPLNIYYCFPLLFSSFLLAPLWITRWLSLASGASGVFFFFSFPFYVAWAFVLRFSNGYMVRELCIRSVFAKKISCIFNHQRTFNHKSNENYGSIR